MAELCYCANKKIFSSSDSGLQKCASRHKKENCSFSPLLPIVIRGGNVFTCRKNRRTIAITIREVVMVEYELGNWKEFIEAMLRK